MFGVRTTLAEVKILTSAIILTAAGVLRKGRHERLFDESRLRSEVDEPLPVEIYILDLVEDLPSPCIKVFVLSHDWNANEIHLRLLDE